jgi:hypothetical protein
VHGEAAGLFSLDARASGSLCQDFTVLHLHGFAGKTLVG